ncbi:MAG: hypothetical protein K8R77_14490 [Anaerolineaceae bacterium]|nr:hypothetical protein [Anaerolineaceae bacterium]
MTPIPEIPTPEEEQTEQSPEEQIPAEIEAALPAEEAASEAVETEEAEQPEAAEAAEEDQTVTEDIPAEPVASEEETPPEPPSRMQVLLRKIGIWTLITLVVFLVCGLLAYFQIYRPVQQNVALLEGQLTAAETELSAAKDELAVAEERYADSQTELEIANARVALHQTLNGITAAQAALEKKNGQDALKALKEAQTALNEMLPVVKQDAPEAADQMDTRLKAAISSLSGDFKTTKADLETLSALLLQQDKIFLGE